MVRWTDNDDDYILGAQDVSSLKYVELRNIEPQVQGNFSQFLYFNHTNIYLQHVYTNMTRTNQKMQVRVARTWDMSSPEYR